MRILPLSIQLVQKRNNQKKVNNNTVPIYNADLKKDTVNFSGDILHDSYSSLNETVNSKIVPFFNDNKQLFQSLIDVNNKINTVVSVFAKSEFQLMDKKFGGYSHPVQNKELAPFQPFIERYYAYVDNLEEYSRLKKILSDDFYNTDETKKALEQAGLVMSKSNPELEKISPLYHKYNQTFIDIDLRNNYQTLMLENKPLSDKFLELKDSLFLTNVYSYSMQMPEIIKLIKSTKEVGSEVEKPSQSVMKTLKTIEYLKNSADSIVEGINNFDSKKPTIVSFVEKFEQGKVTLPAESEINDTYSALMKNCDENAQRYIDRLKAYYKEEYLDKAVKVDFDSVDKTLLEQKEMIDKLNGIKKSIDEKYIKENNEKVLREMGYDIEDFGDD